MRRLHNAMTNALKGCCERSRLELEEGSDRACLFDAVIRGYAGTERHLLVEVKTDDSPQMCRMAVGQLLDYRRHQHDRAKIDLAVLFPRRPSATAVAFLRDVGISALWFDASKRVVKGDVSLASRARSG
jgi:hypothetical protein